MKKDELYTLLDEMSSPDHIIDLLDAPKWPWAKKNHLNEDELFPLLQDFIRSRSSKPETKIRENAYSILGKLLSSMMEAEYCQSGYVRRMRSSTNWRSFTPTRRSDTSEMRMILHCWRSTSIPGFGT